MSETILEHNAAEALRVLGKAADLALQKIAEAQVVALKSAMTNPNIDHDKLMMLIQSVEDFHDEMRRTLDKLGNDFHGKVADHETRLGVLESANVKQNVMLTIGTSILLILVGLLVWHITGKPL